MSEKSRSDNKGGVSLEQLAAMDPEDERMQAQEVRARGGPDAVSTAAQHLSNAKAIELAQSGEGLILQPPNSPVD